MKELERQVELLTEAIEELREANALWRAVVQRHEQLIDNAERILRGEVSPLKD